LFGHSSLWFTVATDPLRRERHPLTIAGIPVVAEDCPIPYVRLRQLTPRAPTLEKRIRSTMQVIEFFHLHTPPFEGFSIRTVVLLSLICFYYHRKKTVPGVLSTPLTSTLVIIRGSSSVFPMMFCRMLVAKPNK
jgi:hypothetical protein